MTKLFVLLISLAFGGLLVLPAQAENGTVSQERQAGRSKYQRSPIPRRTMR